MIERIQIKNFKSVVDLELELGKLNVFIGENGCGKTNILEAITIGGATLDNKLDNEFLYSRGIRVTDYKLMRNKFYENDDFISINYETASNTYISANISYEIMHLFEVNAKNKLTKYQEKSSHSIGYSEYNMDKINNDKNYKGRILDIAKKMGGRLTKIEDYNQEKINEEEFKDNLTIQSFLNYAPENYFLRRFEEEGQIRPLGIRGEGLFKHLVDIYKKEPALLEKIGEHLRLIGWFEGFEIPTDLMFTERRINIKDKYLQELDFFDQRSANEGFLYLLFYFTLFLSPFTPKFFAIDNIDNSLNPKLCAELIRQLVKISKENDKQTILTTHNPAILDGLDLTDDSQRLFTIYRNAEGHTEAKRIKVPKIVKGVEPVRLSEAYIRGYLGGLPKNF